MRVRVKICGVRTSAAAVAACEAGVDAIGFVFAASPRRVGIDEALEIAAGVPAGVTRVAVFRHATVEDVREVVERFRPDLVQVEPDPALVARLGDDVPLLPVFHDGTGVAFEIERYLASARSGVGPVHLEGAGRGGRGVVVDWDRAAVIARRAQLVLAGGLDPNNVAAAVRRVRPWGVDVSSGVESAPGVKDPAAVRRFVEAAREAGLRLDGEGSA